MEAPTTNLSSNRIIHSMDCTPSVYLGMIENMLADIVGKEEVTDGIMGN